MYWSVVEYVVLKNVVGHHILNDIPIHNTYTTTHYILVYSIIHVHIYDIIYYIYIHIHT